MVDVAHPGPRAERPSGPAVVSVAMGPTMSTARLVAALLLTATVASLVSTALLNSILNSSRYLMEIASHQDRVVLGTFFELIAAFASAGIAISLYPVLRPRGEGLALGAVGFRVIEGALYVVSALAVLLLLRLGQDVGVAGRAPGSQMTGALLRTLRDQSGLTGVMAFCAGASMYYYVLYRSILIPRWLSGWGLAGTALALVAATLVLFRATGYMSTTQVVLSIPIGVNELVLAGWLIVRGFSAPERMPVRSERRR
jgi:Domain of unknown function (DUF4386)